MPFPLLNDNELYDFLYVDRIRLASLAAQLLELGDVRQTRLQFGSQATTDTRSGSDLKIIQYNETAANTSNSLVEHLIDTQWAQVLQILTYLHANGMIAQPHESGTFGRLLHIRGYPDLVDLRIIKPLWQDCLEAAMRQQQNGRDISKKQRDFAASIARIMGAMPHSLNLTIHLGTSVKFWGSLFPEFMATSPEQIILRHGAMVSEEWDCIGIFDTAPEGKKPSPEANIDSGQEAVEGVKLMLQALRESLGRPYDAYGIVPLVLFRRIVSTLPEEPPTGSP